MRGKKILAVAVSFVMVAATIQATPIKTGAAEKAQITLENGKKAPKKIDLGKKYKLAVKGQKVVFSSKNTKVITVSKDTIKGVAPGKAKIFAKNSAGKVVAKKKFVVLKRAESIAVKNSKITVGLGGTVSILASVSPGDSTDVLSFASDDVKVAKVDATSGKVTGVSEGTANITVYAKATKKTKDNNKKNIKATVKVTVSADAGKDGEGGEGGEGGGGEGASDTQGKTVKEIIPDVEKSAEALDSTTVGFILPSIKEDVSASTVTVVNKKTSASLEIKNVMYSSAGTGIVELGQPLSNGNYILYYKQGVKGKEVKIPFEYDVDEDDEDDDDEDSSGTSYGVEDDCDITVYVGSTNVTNKSASVNASSGLEIKIEFDPADYEDGSDEGTSEEDDDSDDDYDDEEDDSDDTYEPDTEGIYSYSTWSKYFAVVCVDGDASVSSGKVTTKSSSASFVVLDKIDSYTIAYFTLTK